MKILKEANVKSIERISQKVMLQVIGEESFKKNITGVAIHKDELLSDDPKTYLIEIKKATKNITVVVYFEKNGSKYDYKVSLINHSIDLFDNVELGEVATFLSLIENFTNCKRDMADITQHKIGIIDNTGFNIKELDEQFVDVTRRYNDMLIATDGTERVVGSYIKSTNFLSKETMKDKVTYEILTEDGVREVEIDLIEHDKKVVEYLNSLRKIDITFSEKLISTILSIRNKSKSYWKKHQLGRIQWNAIHKTTFKGNEIIKFIRIFLSNFNGSGMYNNIGLKGHKGCGKNTLIDCASSIFLIPIYEIQGNPFYQKEDLLCDKTLERNQRQQIEIHSKLGLYAEAMANNGWVVLDEYNALRQDIQILLNSATDDRRRLEIPHYGIIRPDDEFPSFMEIATMNEGYEGTAEPNAANVDRKIWIHVSPDNLDIEDLLISKGISKDMNMIRSFAQIFKEIQTAVENNTLEDSAISVRGYIQALNLVNIGYEPKEALIDCVANKIYDNQFCYSKTVEIISSRFA